MMARLACLENLARRLVRDRSGLALVEFAFTVPILLALTLTGAEYTNYITTRMRVSQIALQIADNAARIGEGSPLQAKRISETDINDLLVGAGLQSGEMDVYGRGRVILSSLEPVATPNTTSRYRIAWQRCRGDGDHESTYGDQGDTNLVGMGPTGQQVTAPDDGATMFVEVYYEYRPLVSQRLVPTSTMVETASMMVRDRRDRTQVYNTEAAAVSRCS